MTATLQELEEKGLTLWQADPDRARLLFKELYLSGRKSVNIAEVIGVPKQTAFFWASKLKPLKKEITDARYEYLATFNGELAQKVRSLADEVILEQLIAIKESGEELTVKDLKLLGDLGYGMDRRDRLEQGKPTDHVLKSEIHMTDQELRSKTMSIIKEMVQADPMTEIEDASWSEVEEDGEDEEAGSPPGVQALPEPKGDTGEASPEVVSTQGADSSGESPVRDGES